MVSITKSLNQVQYLVVSEISRGVGPNDISCNGIRKGKKKKEEKKKVFQSLLSLSKFSVIMPEPSIQQWDKGESNSQVFKFFQRKLGLWAVP